MTFTKCPLCNGEAKEYYSLKLRIFMQCRQCFSVFTHPESYISEAEEKAHYQCHVNNPADTGYQRFVSPIVDNILNNFTPQHKGLDFGSGTGSPIVKLLEDNDYSISQYDLFFHNDIEVLQQQYDYIACSEVAEHFKQPYKEFKQLKDLLLPNGKLYVMTELFDENSDFEAWYYKNDPTHVFLYHQNAFEWIQKEFDFKEVSYSKRLVTLEL